MRARRLVLIAGLLACALPLAAARRPHIRLGGIAVGAGYSNFGPFGYPYYGWWPGYWDWGYLPVYHPGYFNGFARGPHMGEVKLQADPKAEVYLNGAYAGTAGHLKHMRLAAGAYNLEVKSPGGGSFTRRIYVLTGKTLHIDAAPMEAQR